MSAIHSMSRSQDAQNDAISRNSAVHGWLLRKITAVEEVSLPSAMTLAGWAMIAPAACGLPFESDAIADPPSIPDNHALQLPTGSAHESQTDASRW
jgi:hypothetical protein